MPVPPTMHMKYGIFAPSQRAPLGLGSFLVDFTWQVLAAVWGVDPMECSL